MEASREEDYGKASENFLKAIEYKSKEEEIYLLYFNALLPQDQDPEYLTKTKDAIDTMRNSFLDNEKSDMYENETVMFQVAKKCLEVNDGAYAVMLLNILSI
jgi:serine/threonine-protein kinase